MWKVTWDHLDHKKVTDVEGGITVDGDPLPDEGTVIKFRMFDDDGELYFSGELTDDDECVNQVSALSWGTWDSGCTTIKVERNGVWEQDIG